jgi:hypothetical protein
MGSTLQEVQLRLKALAGVTKGAMITVAKVVFPGYVRFSCRNEPAVFRLSGRLVCVNSPFRNR